MFLRALLGVFAISSLAASASAGTLIAAELELTFRGIPIKIVGTAPAGTLDPASNRFTLEPGAVFSTGFCLGSAPGCRPLSVPLTPPQTRISVSFAANGGIDATLDQQTILACDCAGIDGRIALRAKIGKAPAFTTLEVPLRLGVQTTTRVAPTTSTYGTPARTVFADAWHFGPVTQTGLTSRGDAQPDVMTTGGVSVNEFGIVVVSLVSLSRVRVRGLIEATFAVPARLSLFYAGDESSTPSVYACPEPAAPLLLGGAALAVAFGRRKLGRPPRPRSAPQLTAGATRAANKLR